MSRTEAPATAHADHQPGDPGRPVSYGTAQAPTGRGPNGEDVAQVADGAGSAKGPNGANVGASANGAASAKGPNGANGSVEPPDLRGEHLGGSLLRREILTALREGGPASPDGLAERLGASRTGVLQQLRALQSANLVDRQTVRHGVGRPRHLYDVTLDAQDLFPTNYDGLAAGLLSAVGAVGGESLIEEVFQARRRQLSDRIRARFAARLEADAPLEDRVRELAVLQDEQGYLCRADIDGDGVIRLREHNCAIYRVAMGLSAACDAELQLFRDVLDADVVRESHIASGDRCCSYRISDPRRDGG